MNIIHLLYMEKSQTELNKFKDLYSNLTYFDEYGGSVFLFIIITIVVFIGVSYCYVMINISPIKNNWVAERCNPYVIPFAGIINKPDNMTATQFTEQNFNFCAQNILKDITGFAVEPLTFITYAITESITAIRDALQAIRTMFDKIRNDFLSVSSEIMDRLANIMIPIQQIIIAVKDMFGKIQGTLTAVLYTFLGSYYTLQSLLGAIAQTVILFLIALAAAIIFAWIFPFTWGIAISMTSIFIALSIPLAIMLAFLIDVLHVNINMSLPGLPKQPSIQCFDKNTLLTMNDGTEKRIIDIEVGEKLMNNNMVTAKMQVPTKGSQMYNLNNIVVSDSHMVKEGNKWIRVSKHFKAKKLPEYKEEYLYCLNTESKEIHLNGNIFSDWDEMNEDDIESIQIIHRMNKYNTNDLGENTFDKSYIHKYFDGGFKGCTPIILKNGGNHEIQHIKIGDVLEYGEIVCGIVALEGKKMENHFIYNLGKLDQYVEGGPNLNVCDRNIKYTSTLNMKEKIKTVKKQNKLYHLITNKKTFHVCGIKFYDYNASIDLLLDKNRGKLLSMKYV